MLIRLFLAAMVMLLLAAAASVTSFDRLDAQTGRIAFPDSGICSGSTYQAALLTTKHCVTPEPASLTYRSVTRKVRRTVIEGENAIVVFDGAASLGMSVKLGPAPKVGDKVWLVGNVAGMNQVYREGVVSGWKDGAFLIDCRCWQGDSGAGVFNQRGDLVGIFYGRRVWTGAGGDSFDYPFAYPLAFTPEQWKEAAQ